MEPFKICFLVLVASGFYASAQQTYRCNFENGMCTNFLTNSRDNKQNWKLGKGKVNAADTGPSIDHTYGNATGSYLFVNVTATNKQKVSLETSISLSSPYCVRFFYHMYGADVGDFTVQVQRTWESATDYFTRSGSQGDRWKEARFSVTQNRFQNNYKVVWTVKHNSRVNVRGDIALDDIEMTPGQCRDSTNDATKLCTFDDFNCGYTTTNLEGLNWEWHTDSGASNDFATKPSVDHTRGTETGGYWFAGVKTGGILTIGQSAEEKFGMLSSPVYKKPADKTNCLHFYYYIDGDGTSWAWGEVIEAYIQAYINPIEFPQSDDKRVWLTTKAKNVTYHRQWTYVEAKAEITTQFQIQFIAGIYSKVEALIAIDDIKLFPGKCPEAGSCDFEDDKCTYRDGQSGFNWIRKSWKSKTNQEIGPTTDKTRENEEGSFKNSVG